jgi:alpha-ketoglutarate-dependent taurine dioxygenase
MAHIHNTLNGKFGLMITAVSRQDLSDPEFQAKARDLWVQHGGLLAVRGADLASLLPSELLDWSKVFGVVEQEGMAAREEKSVDGFPILRIGNVRDEKGNLRASLARVPELQSDADIRYNPEIRRPVWHTDSTFRKRPPIGSVFHCRCAPDHGGETLFADMRAGYASLSSETRAGLKELEAVCSLAHHDKKISFYSPDYPILTPKQRADNPPNRVPIVLHHPISGEPAFYGLNSSTCAVLSKGEEISQALLDRCDLDGEEHPSVGIIRDLLPFLTGPEFTVKWKWQTGDVVVWDNRCTIHAATGYDYEKYLREMWRLTLNAPAAVTETSPK